MTRHRVVLWLAAALVAAPFAPLVVQSLAFRWAWPDLLPATWWWERRDVAPAPLAWDYVLSPYSRVGEATLNTVGIGLAVTALALMVCLPAARALARRPHPGLEAAVALPLLVPEAAVALALTVLFVRAGLAGSYAGIVVAHLIPTLPYATRLLTAVWRGLPPDFEEQAALLGATPAQVMTRVTLPMLLPGILAAGLMTFLVSSNVFLLTFLLGQGSVVTLPTLLFAKLGGGALDASTAGIALVVALPGLALMLLADRLLPRDAWAKGFGA